MRRGVVAAWLVRSLREGGKGRGIGEVSLIARVQDVSRNTQI